MQEVSSEILLSKVHVEFEIRQSDFIVMASKKNHLEASTINIMFDRNSIVDLLMSRDLSKEAQFNI